MQRIRFRVKKSDPDNPSLKGIFEAVIQKCIKTKTEDICEIQLTRWPDTNPNHDYLKSLFTRMTRNLGSGPYAYRWQVGDLDYILQMQ